MTLSAGTKLGPYEILSPLGAGGMGEVYRAKDTILGREIAIKILPADVASSPERLQRFEREAKTVAALNHPNIVTIFGIEESNDHRFIAMELVDGETLDRMIAPGGMPLAKIFDIAIPLSDALAAAHDKGIVHRDLKPANVMVTKEGRVKVLDFGLAKLTAAGQGGSSPDDVTMSAPLTGRGVVMGTVPYMSPEQLKSDPLDHRTDLFSLGVMLYEMATGQRPFKGHKSAEMMSSILRDTPRPLHELNSVLPRHLGRIIEHCLEKNAEDRLQSAKDVRNELRALRKEVDSGSEFTEPVSVATTASQPPSSTSTIPSGSAMSAPTRRGEFWIGVGVIAVVIVLVGLWIGRSGKLSDTTADRTDLATRASVEPNRPVASEEQPRLGTVLAIMPFNNISNDPNTDYLSNEIPASIIDKLSGLSALNVISRSGSFRFDPSEEDASSFGQSLGASVVLTGQLNARGESLTIRAELVDVATNQQLWSKRYPRELSDIMAVEEDITQDISEALRLQLTAKEQTHLTEVQTVNPSAYRSFLQGRFWTNKFTADSYRKAVFHFEQAIQDDPKYASAYAGLAITYTLLGGWSGDMPPREAFPRAKNAVSKALEMNPTLAAAHGSLAFIRLLYDWDFQGAEQEFKHAIRINPDYSDVHGQYALLLHAMGRFDDAQEERKRALELDPLSPITQTALAQGYTQNGEYEQAIKICKEVLRQDSSFLPAYQALGLVYFEQGMYEDAITAFQQNAQVNRNAYTLGWLGVSYARAGNRTDALATLDGIEQDSKEEKGCLSAATVHAALGNVGRAFELLEIAFRERESRLVFLNTQNLPFDNLRGDPRFDDLLRRIGLKPESKSVSTVRDQNKKTMLAVLPFTNLSGDPEQEYFSDGMTEEMITRLGRLRPDLLGVIARTSAMRYKRTDKPIDQIGRELGVAYVVEGGVRRAGNRVRINAQLIQVSDQTQLWGDSYTRDLSDVFAVQEEVAEAIAESLSVELLPEQQIARSKAPPESAAAYDAYLLGRSYWAKRTPESLHTAIKHFKHAIELDPNYALAYCGLADAWSVMPWYVPGPYNKINAEAMKAAERALALNDSLAEAHVSMACVLADGGDWETANEHYQKAVAIDPNNATAHQWYGGTLSIQGRFDQATEEFEKAITFDPLSAVMHNEYGDGSVIARRFDKAIEQLNKAIRLQLNFKIANYSLTWAYIGKEDHDAAAKAFQSYLRVIDQPAESITKFRRTYDTSGLRAGFLEWLDSLGNDSNSKGIGPERRAPLYAWCNEKDRAFELLDRAIERGSPLVNIVATYFPYDNLRDDPRWDAFLRKAGLHKIENPDPSSTP